MANQLSHRLIVRSVWLCMGLFFAISTPAWSRLPPIIAITDKPSSQLSQPVAASPFVAAPWVSPSLLQQGIAHYQAEQYVLALERWSQALKAPEMTGDKLTQALLHSNLSLAYQHLGHWDMAHTEVQSSLTLLESQPSGTNQTSYLAILAKARNTEGRWYWSKGESERALGSWRQATVAYTQAGDRRGTILGKINQSKALRALGLGNQTIETLKTVEQSFSQFAYEPELKAWALWQLGQAYRQVGKLGEAEEKLNSALALDVVNASLQSSLRLEQGNIELALANKVKAIGRDATSHTQAALKLYQQSAEQALSPNAQLQGQLNQLSLLVKTEDWNAASALWPTIRPKLDALPLSRHSIYAQLNFAQSLMTLGRTGWEQPNHSLLVGLKSERKLQAKAQIPSPQEIAQQLRHTVDQARALSDPIAESYALGQLGNLYEHREQWDDAQQLTEAALHLLDSSQSLDSRYRWEWQLGRLLTQRNDTEAAVYAYKSAVATLKTVRRDLLEVDADVQFSFRDNVTPIYRELVELLLRTDNGSLPSQDNLKAAIERINDLQLTELANFLGCDLNYIIPLNQVEADPNAAFLYPIILSDRIAVILKLPGQEDLQFAQTRLPQAEIEQTLTLLRQDLSEEESRTPEVLDNAKLAYNWLIKPFKQTLSQTPEINTLVFVQDGPLRNLPMSVLFDSEKRRYLLQDYAVAVAPRLELFEPRPLPKHLSVFTGGVGFSQELGQNRFEPIENLESELQGLAEHVSTNSPLLNEAFTFEKLRQQLNKSPFSVIHLKTHGVFSSDPEETFIVAFNERIRGQALGNLIQIASTDLEQPLELLVLSACSTAQGDDRAVLGLAGVAVQAGARSTLSTLWDAQDDPNTELMIEFYRALAQPDATRAKALRQAQLQLLEQGYTAPHLWANYVLVGNWL